MVVIQDAVKQVIGFLCCRDWNKRSICVGLGVQWCEPGQSMSNPLRALGPEQLPTKVSHQGKLFGFESMFCLIFSVLGKTSSAPCPMEREDRVLPNSAFAEHRLQLFILSQDLTFFMIFVVPQRFSAPDIMELLLILLNVIGLLFERQMFLFLEEHTKVFIGGLLMSSIFKCFSKCIIDKPKTNYQNGWVGMVVYTFSPSTQEIKGRGF